MKTLKFIKVIFSIIGLGLLVGSFFLYQNTSEFLEKAVKAEGVVIDLVRKRSSDSTTYAPTIRFTTNNGTMIEFTSSTSSNPPSYSRGEQVAVFYLPEQPDEAKINGFFSLWGAAVIVAGIGTVFFLVGFGMIFYGIRKQRKKEHLLQRGTRINTDFQSVNRNTSIKVNGRSPFVISSQWLNPRTNELHIFESESIWFDPEDHIKGESVMVYIDPNDPSDYYMDISFLPALAKT